MEPSQPTALQQALRRFEEGHARGPREIAERELGELLLFVIRLADRLGIDFFAVAENRILAEASKSSQRPGEPRY